MMIYKPKALIPDPAYAIGLMGGWGTASNFWKLGLESLPILINAPLFPI